MLVNIITCGNDEGLVFIEISQPKPYQNRMKSCTNAKGFCFGSDTYFIKIFIVLIEARYMH